MSAIVHIETIAELNKVLHQSKGRHPLTSVVDLTKIEERFDPGMKISTGFYVIMFKNYCTNKIRWKILRFSGGNFSMPSTETGCFYSSIRKNITSQRD